MKNTYLFILLSITVLLASCASDENTDITFDVPQDYTFERNGTTSVAYTGQTTRINMATELIRGLLDFDASEQTLQEMYTNTTADGGDANPFADSALNDATKSVASKVAASRDFFSANTAEAAIIKADFSTWITAQVKEVYPNEMIEAIPGVPGQLADGSTVRYVNSQGLEYNQAVNKGLIGALMVDQMLNNYLSPAVLDEGDNRTMNDLGSVADGQNYTTMEHKWDEAYGYLFGKAVDPTDPIASLGNDDFLNKYIARVNADPDFNGIAQEVFDAFKLGRAAIVAGDYEVRNQQAETIKALISEIIGIRAVYYLQQANLALPSTGNAYGAAFHDLSEGFGFIYSLRFTRKPNSTEPYLTANEVERLLNTMLEGNGFWDITPAILDQMSEEIASKFDFTVEQAGS